MVRRSSQSETAQQRIETEMIRERLAEHSRLSRGVGVEDHVEEPRWNQPAKPVGSVRQVAKDRENEDVNESFGELAVIKRSHSGNKAEHGRESRTRSARRSRVNGCWCVGRRSRNGSFQASGEAILAIDHAADIALAALAKRLSTSTAVGACHLVCVNGAGHASTLLMELPMGYKPRESSVLLKSSALLIFVSASMPFHAARVSLVLPCFNSLVLRFASSTFCRSML